MCASSRTTSWRPGSSRSATSCPSSTGSSCSRTTTGSTTRSSSASSSCAPSARRGCAETRTVRQAGRRGRRRAAGDARLHERHDRAAHRWRTAFVLRCCHVCRTGSDEAAGGRRICLCARRLRSSRRLPVWLDLLPDCQARIDCDDRHRAGSHHWYVPPHDLSGRTDPVVAGDDHEGARGGHRRNRVHHLHQLHRGEKGRRVPVVLHIPEGCDDRHDHRWRIHFRPRDLGELSYRLRNCDGRLRRIHGRAHRGTLGVRRLESGDDRIRRDARSAKKLADRVDSRRRDCCRSLHGCECGGAVRDAGGCDCCFAEAGFAGHGDRVGSPGSGTGVGGYGFVDASDAEWQFR